MKKIILLFLVVAIFPFFGVSQSIENLDYISPFYNGMAAVEKDGQWAFVNKKGEITIDFRNDLVETQFPEGNFPVFKNDRCLIKAERDGITYFGYINTCGTTVIEPQYLNALNFNDGYAIVLELIKEQVGRNDALGKNVVYDKYLEALISTEGQLKTYLSPKRVNVLLDKKFLKAPPKITSKYISDNLYAVKGENEKWGIIHTDQ